MVKEVLARGRNYAVVTGGDSFVAQVRKDSEWQTRGESSWRQCRADKHKVTLRRNAHRG